MSTGFSCTVGGAARGPTASAGSSGDRGRDEDLLGCCAWPATARFRRPTLASPEERLRVHQRDDVAVGVVEPGGLEVAGAVDVAGMARGSSGNAGDATAAWLSGSAVTARPGTPHA